MTTQSKTGHTPNPIRVLYAEDSSVDADLTKSRFAREAPEFVLQVVSTGEECLRRLHGGDYDLILLDHKLPDMDGLDLLRAARGVGTDLPIVIVTGRGDEELAVQALRLGAAQYVSKQGEYLSVLPDVLKSVYQEYQKRGELGRPAAVRVLLVEHVETDIDLTIRYFSDHARHCVLDVSRSSEEALALIHGGTTYDLVVIDLRMPGMNALDFLSELRLRNVHFPCIVITGRGDENAAVAALRLGAYDYIVKRDNYLLRLPHAVENAVARFQLDQANERLQEELTSANASLEENVKARTAELEREITERKRAEILLGERQHFLQQVLDTEPGTVYVYDLTTRHNVYINRHWLTAYGYSVEETHAMGSEVLERVFHPDDLARITAHHDTCRRAGDQEIRGIEYRVRTKAGEWRWLYSRDTPFARDESGHVTQILGIAHDITARKQAEAEIHRLNESLEQRVAERTAQLALANQELESFSASVSHDLRAPLRVIDGFSKLLLDDYRDRLDATGQDYLRRVRAATERMGELIDDLLSLAHVTRAPLRRERVDLSAMAQAVVSALRATDPGRMVDVVMAPDVTVRGDPGLLRIALENLLGNAWKFTGRTDRPRIEFGVRRDPEAVYWVRDNGAGFDAAYTERLFTAFQRLHTADEFLGTGIGLAIVQRIVQRHGGRVWAEGAVGKGATVYFTLGEHEVNEPHPTAGERAPA